MLSALILLIPENAYLLALVLAGILIMIGFRKAGVGLVVCILLFAVLGPFIEALIEVLPDWLLILLLLGFVLSMTRLVFGRRVAGNVISLLLYDLLRLPLRLLGRLLRRPLRGR
jgi:hypothetical protein